MRELRRLCLLATTALLGLTFGCFSPGGCVGPRILLAEVRGTGFLPEAGTELHVAWIGTGALAPALAVGEAAISTTGGFEVLLSAVVASAASPSFRFAYYADLDGNGRCDPGDHVWLSPIVLVSETSVSSITRADSTSYSPSACASFP